MQLHRFPAGRLAPAISALLGLAALTGGTSAFAQTTFSNPTPITIPDAGVATPYPSNILVSGLSGTITNFTVTLTGFSHTFPDDIAAIIVGPSGQKTLLFDGPGGGDDAVNLNFSFNDAAAASLPNSGPLASGTYRPGQQEFLPFNLAAPAPAGPYATSFAGGGFLGATPNGTYSLYVQDFAAGDIGVFAGGWSVTITTTDEVIPEPGTLALLGVLALPGLPLALRRRGK